MLNRAYSTFEIKSVDEAQRIIEGFASTPTTDRQQDVLESAGAEFKLPFPLLWQHRHDQPIGQVLSAKVTKAGVFIKAKIAEAGILPRIDEAWTLIRHGLVRGLSVGFRPLEVEQIKGSFGMRFIRWELLETSAVTVAANAEASITSIKAIDAEHLPAVTGDPVFAVNPVIPSGATDIPRAAKAAQATKGARHMTIPEQITQFEASRQAKNARMTELMTKAAEGGSTLDETESQEYDGLDTEIKQIDAHLTRLAALEKSNKAAAVPAVGKTPEEASQSRGGHVVTVKSNLPPGTAFTRYAMALATSRGSRFEAAEYAKRWERETPEVALVLKAAMAAGTTTDSDWAAPLVVYQNMASEFVELLRPATIIGRIPGLRRVPFNVTMPTQTQGSTVGWVGQGKPKPVSELKFGQLSLGMAKAAGIVVLSEELVRSSAPSAEAIVRQDLIDTMAQFLDLQFVDPAVAAVSNVSPASITNGASVVDSTGTNAAAWRADFKTAAALFTAANLSMAGSVLLMTETQALSFSLIQNALGQSEFPNIGMTGGTLMGIPVVASENIPAEGGSPAGNRIILVKPSEILLADDGGVALDVSREASLQMNSTPDDPASASTVMISLWQNNLVGLRAERFINWLRRRSQAVVVIEGAVYTG